MRSSGSTLRDVAQFRGRRDIQPRGGGFHRAGRANPGSPSRRTHWHPVRVPQGADRWREDPHRRPRRGHDLRHAAPGQGRHAGSCSGSPRATPSARRPCGRSRTRTTPTARSWRAVSARPFTSWTTGRRFRMRPDQVRDGVSVIVSTMQAMKREDKEGLRPTRTTATSSLTSPEEDEREGVSVLAVRGDPARAGRSSSPTRGTTRRRCWRWT